MLFEQGISARKFASAKVDAFEGSVAGSLSSLFKPDDNANHLERRSHGSDESG